MGGFEIIAPLLLAAGTAGDIVSTQQQAARQRRATLLQADRERRERVRQLREATAANRARAASAGLSGGGSAAAIERGLHERSEQLAKDTRQDARLRLSEIEGQRSASLLDIAERRTRQALGLLDDLNSQSEEGAVR